jgi:amidohydrolase
VILDQLSADSIAELVALRHVLHQHPDLSGHEAATAARIVQALQPLGPDQIWQNVGGHGVVAEYRGAAAGPSVLLRCELDGLPITELGGLAYTSTIPGQGHLCGHDGHMATILGVARCLHQRRPTRGRVLLLFQPAEETGSGAKAVIDDPRWPQLRPDYAFAYHNLPGHPLGQVLLRAGPTNCASQGMKLQLHGKSAHAAQPQHGLSPGPAMAQLMQILPGLGQGTIDDAGFALATLTHAALGAPSFGVAPADGELRVTLRAMTNQRMQALQAAAERAVADQAGAQGLKLQISYHDVFAAVHNCPKATALAQAAAVGCGFAPQHMPQALPFSEDFGRFGDDGARAALLYVGAGQDHPQLHNPDYDFPDALIAPVVRLFMAILAQALGQPLS